MKLIGRLDHEDLFERTDRGWCPTALFWGLDWSLGCLCPQASAALVARLPVSLLYLAGFDSYSVTVLAWRSQEEMDCAEWARAVAATLGASVSAAQCVSIHWAAENLARALVRDLARARARALDLDRADREQLGRVTCALLLYLAEVGRKGMPEQMTRAELKETRRELAARIEKEAPLPDAWSPLGYLDATLEHMDGDVLDLRPETVLPRFAKTINDICDEAEAKKRPKK